MSDQDWCAHEMGHFTHQCKTSGLSCFLSHILCLKNSCNVTCSDGPYVYNVILPSVLLYFFPCSTVNVVLHGCLYTRMNIVACVCAYVNVYFLQSIPYKPFSISSELIVNTFSVGLYDHFETVLEILVDLLMFQHETSSETCGLFLHTVVSLIH